MGKYRARGEEETLIKFSDHEWETMGRKEKRP